MQIRIVPSLCDFFFFFLNHPHRPKELKPSVNKIKFLKPNMNSVWNNEYERKYYLKTHYYLFISYIFSIRCSLCYKEASLFMIPVAWRNFCHLVLVLMQPNRRARGILFFFCDIVIIWCYNILCNFALSVSWRRSFNHVFFFRLRMRLFIFLFNVGSVSAAGRNRKTVSVSDHFYYSAILHPLN